MIPVATRLLLLVLAGAGLASPVHAQAAASAEAAVRQADLDLARAVAADDRAGFRELVAEDARFFGAGGVLEGREAIVEGWAPFFEKDGPSLEWEPTHAEVSGDLGYTTGTYVRTMVDEQGQRRVGRGRYVSVWRRGPDGRWRIVADIGTPPELDP